MQGVPYIAQHLAQDITAFGLALDIAGAWILFKTSPKIIENWKETDKEKKEREDRRIIHWSGPTILTIGFVCQIIGNYLQRGG